MCAFTVSNVHLYFLSYDTCCKDTKCKTWHSPNCPQCPNNYSGNHGLCIRVYDPTLTHPAGYKLQMKNNGSACVKCPMGNVIKNDSTKISCVKSRWH